MMGACNSLNSGSNLIAAAPRPRIWAVSLALRRSLLKIAASGNRVARDLMALEPFCDKCVAS